MGRVVIAGGTGFLGRNLARHLTASGHDVVVFSRNTPANAVGWQHAQWDARTVSDWVRHLDGAAALVNLAGRTVDCVKTPAHCDEILRSRVESTIALGRALRTVKHLPRVWVQMATAHIYGDPPEAVCDEDSPFGLPAMSWMVRVAAPLLGTDPELALFGRYCVSRRLREEGFDFQFPDLRAALRDLYAPVPRV